MDGRTGKEQLLTHIETRRRCINTFLRKAKPRAERLTLVSIVSSALAAALTAGPALGGPSFTLFMASSLGLSESASVWRPLCLLAMIVSVVAAITANLRESKNAQARIMMAETCATELDLICVFLKFDRVSLNEALRSYQESVVKIAFIPGERALRVG